MEKRSRRKSIGYVHHNPTLFGGVVYPCPSDPFHIDYLTVSTITFFRLSKISRTSRTENSVTSFKTPRGIGVLKIHTGTTFTYDVAWKRVHSMRSGRKKKRFPHVRSRIVT